MKLRDVAAAACRVLGLYVGVQAVRLLGDLVNRLILQEPARFWAGAAASLALMAGAALALWRGADSLADRIAPAPAGPAGTSVDIGRAASLAVWLLGLFFVIQGLAILIGRILDAVTAQAIVERSILTSLQRSPIAPFLRTTNPERRAAIASAITAAIESGVGAYLLANADRLTSRWRGQSPGPNA